MYAFAWEYLRGLLTHGLFPSLSYGKTLLGSTQATKPRIPNGFMSIQMNLQSG